MIKLSEKYMTINEAAKKWNCSYSWVYHLFKSNKLKGAEQIGSTIIIPSKMEKPPDSRIKSGKYIGYRKNRKAKM